MKTLFKFVAVVMFLCIVAFLLGVMAGRATRPSIEKIEAPKIQEQSLQEKDPMPAPAPVVAEAPKKQKQEVHPYDNPKFRKKFILERSIEDIRKDNYGIGNSKPILITHHKGGKRLDQEKLEKTVRAVLQRMPNLKTSDELVALLVETMETETGLGWEKVETGIKKWRNYGICQFRPATAKEMISWLKFIRKDVYQAVMDLQDKKHDLLWNLSYNVPFSVALMAQYYWRVIPDLSANIQTVELRGEAWAAAYNTHLGLGTVNDYLTRVQRLQGGK